MSLELTMLQEAKTQRDTARTFYGYNHRNRIGNGEFFDTLNTTSKDFPLLSPRSPRGIVKQLTKPHGLYALNGLIYVDGKVIYYNDKPTTYVDEDSDKTFVGMGAEVIIFPDKIAFNTYTRRVRHLEQHNEATFVTAELCRVDGTRYDVDKTSSTEPEKPFHGMLWLDTSDPELWELKIYSEAEHRWGAVSTTYCRLNGMSLGYNLKDYDAVDIQGITGEDVQDLNGSHIVYKAGDDFIVITGTSVKWKGYYQNETVTVDRKLPDMDFVCQHENRLWGCSNKTHEIFCSALGDPATWNRFLGISTDSYVATVGSPGDFTGCISHGGYVLFFKEDRIHKMYGSQPSNFQLTEIVCRGCAKGSHDSLCSVNEVLYWKSREDVCAYTSSMPTGIGDNLGDDVYVNASSGAAGRFLYMNMDDASGKRWMFTYDTEKNVWHKQDHINARWMTSVDTSLYCIDDLGRIIDLTGNQGEPEKPVHWMVETGDLGIDSQNNSYVGSMSPDARYLSKIQVRMDLDTGSHIAFAVQYDHQDEWKEVYRMAANGKRSILVPIIPRRHDSIRMRIYGVGPCKIYSFAKTVEDGGFRE